MNREACLSLAMRVVTLLERVTANKTTIVDDLGQIIVRQADVLAALNTARELENEVRDG